MFSHLNYLVISLLLKFFITKLLLMTIFGFFECLCFPLLSSPKIHKLHPRSSPCVFLGYPSSHSGYKCYNIPSRKIIVSHHVIFDETVFPFSQASIHNPHEYDFLDNNLPLILLQPNEPNFSGPIPHIPRPNLAPNPPVILSPIPNLSTSPTRPSPD